jgi:hypothetical protein
MRIQTEYMIFKIVEWLVVAMISRHTSSVPKEDDVLPCLLYSDLRYSQACCRYFWVLQGMSSAFPELLPAPHVILDGSEFLSDSLRCSETCHCRYHCTLVPVIIEPSYAQGQLGCPATIDPSMFTLHILSDHPGCSKWLNFIVLI